MKLYDVEESAQDNLIDDQPLMDRTDFGMRDDEKNKKRSKFNVNQFDDFK
jgi:hypothetical protein